MSVSKAKPWLLLCTTLLTACTTSSTPMLSGKALEAAAAKGDVNAQYQLAQQLAQSDNFPQAMSLMQQVGNHATFSNEKQIQRGNAARQVGDWYEAGLGEPRNQSLALLWWQKASALGNAQASYRLAQMCQKKKGTGLNADCVEPFETAAKKGHPEAQLALAKWLTGKKGAEQQALQWLEKASAQSQPEAMYLLAMRYEKGDGVDKREDAAQRGYLQAAEKGYPPALRWQGQHSEGKTAFEWYQKAAQGGDTTSQLWLAEAYAAGKNIPHDDDKSLLWLTRAMQGGDPRALFLYGQRQTDIKERERYFELAAKGNDSNAQMALARLYIARGEDARSLKLWAGLAEKGRPQHRYAYAEMLRSGQGGKEDFTQAFRQYRLAAMQGYTPAQYRMGMMRQEGYGATRNRIHAYAWYSLAAAKGMKDAYAALNDIEATMKPEEIQSAQKLAMRWGEQIAKRRHQGDSPIPADVE